MKKPLQVFTTVGLLLFIVIILLNPKSTKREVVLINSSSEPVEIKVQGITLFEIDNIPQIIQSGGYIETGREYKDAAIGYTHTVIEYPVKVMWKLENQKDFQEKDFYEIEGLFDSYQIKEEEIPHHLFSEGTHQNPRHKIKISRGSIVVGINKALEPKVFYLRGGRKGLPSIRFKYQELNKR